MSIIPSSEKHSFLLALSGCFFAGCGLVAAFAPLQWAVLAFLSIAVLFWFCREADARTSFWLGLAFGYGQFGIGVSWVYVSLHTYGGMPLWMGGIAVLLFSGILGIFVALATYSSAKLCPQGGRERLCVLACFWLIFEWLKGWAFTGFPWLEIGYTQTPTWLFGFAAIGGVYLVSFAVVLLSACLVWLYQYPAKYIPLATLAITIVLAWFANHQSWSVPTGTPINIGLVQPNIPIDNKWQPRYRNDIIAKLITMSREFEAIKRPDKSSLETPQGHTEVDLVIWPETALPLYYQQTDNAFWRDLVPANTALLTGIADSLGEARAYNAAALSCDGAVQIYRKRHLVPFGEYLPMRFLLTWILDYLQFPMSDFSFWNGQQTLSCKGGDINIALSICYEDAFADEMRSHLGDATLLVNISEDAWFGDSLAPHQRLQMAQMRARELSRPLLRSANTGPSAVINHRGEVVALTAQFEAATLVRSVQAQSGETLYKRFGNWIIYLSMLLLAGVALHSRLRSRLQVTA